MYAYLSLIISLHLFMLPLHHAQDSNECNKTFSCGEYVKEIRYPFWGGDRPKNCGLEAFKLECENDEKTVLHMRHSKTKFRVFSIHTSSREIEMGRIDQVSDDSCPWRDNINATFDEIFLIMAKELKSSTCSSIVVLIYLLWTPSLLIYRARRVELKELLKRGNLELEELLNPSFIMFYKVIDSACLVCENSGKECVLNSSGLLACRCPNNGDVSHTCSKCTVFLSP